MAGVLSEIKNPTQSKGHTARNAKERKWLLTESYESFPRETPMAFPHVYTVYGENSKEKQ